MFDDSLYFGSARRLYFPSERLIESSRQQPSLHSFRVGLPNRPMLGSRWQRYNDNRRARIHLPRRECPCDRSILPPPESLPAICASPPDIILRSSTTRHLQ